MSKYKGSKLDPQKALDKNAKELRDIALKASKTAGTKPSPTKRRENEQR